MNLKKMLCEHTFFFFFLSLPTRAVSEDREQISHGL